MSGMVVIGADNWADIAFHQRPASAVFVQPGMPGLVDAALPSTVAAMRLGPADLEGRRGEAIQLSARLSRVGGGPRQSLWGGIHATQQQWRPRPHTQCTALRLIEAPRF